MLVLGDPPAFSVEEFRESAAPILVEDDLAEFDRVVAGQTEEGNSFFSAEWHRTDMQIRNEIARMRATRRSVEVRSYLKDHQGYSVAIADGVADAYARPNPAERERSLDRLRWSWLDELAARDAFGLTAILAYVVKLQLAVRWAGMDVERGRKQCEDVLSDYLKQEDQNKITDNEDIPQRGEGQNE